VTACSLGMGPLHVAAVLAAAAGAGACAGSLPCWTGPRPVDGANASDGLPMVEGRTTRTIHVGTPAMGHYSECSSSLVGKRV